MSLWDSNTQGSMREAVGDSLVLIADMGVCRATVQ
jgi:hypothetical protein